MIPKELANKLLDFYQHNPQRWTQNAYARDWKGHPTSSDSSNAVCWCVLGACNLLYVSYFDVLDLEAAVAVDIERFNDECADFNEFRTKLEKVANGNLS
jgi:hypothetical protein